MFPFTLVPAYGLPVYASQCPLPDTTQDSVRGCWLGFAAVTISDDRLPCACKAQLSHDRSTVRPLATIRCVCAHALVNYVRPLELLNCAPIDPLRAKRDEARQARVLAYPSGSPRKSPSCPSWHRAPAPRRNDSVLLDRASAMRQPTLASGLSLPKIISARSDDAALTESARQQRPRAVGPLD